MSSKTGDLLLELEAVDGSVRDAWVSRSRQWNEAALFDEHLPMFQSFKI